MRDLPPLHVGAAGGLRRAQRSAARRRIALAVGLCLGLLAASSLSAAGRSGPQLRLQAGVFDPVTERAPIPARLRLVEEPEQGLFVVQFHRSIDRVLLNRLRSTGVEPLHYLPERSYVVRLPAGGKSAVLALPEVRWVGPVQPGWKLSPDLGRRPFRDPTGRREGGRLYATIDLFRGSALETTLPRIVDTGAEVIRSDSFGDTRRIRLRATRGQLEQIARLQDVAWIEEVGEITTRNDTAHWVVQTDVSDAKTIWDHGLHGEGQILGHIDGRLDINSCYFRDPSNNTPGPSHRKVVAYRSSIGLGADGHGTHTAGTLAGDRFPIDGTLVNNGHAYAARISHAALGDISGLNNTPSNLYNYLSLAYGDGARLHSNSWGDDVVSSYSTWARDIDLYSYNFEDALVVFAITNGGVLRSPENAKNVLAVGASDNGLSADGHCSGGTGPTPDGRRKPEIYAPGCGIISTRSSFSCSTISRTGTSMAAPAITGAGALVRQYFEEGWYPTGTRVPGDAITPSGALVKAMLLNSTVDMTGVSGYPSDLEGWGRVLLENALYFDGDPRNLAMLADLRNAGGLTTGESASFPLLVNGVDEELKVTLVFTDPAAPLLSLSPAINDLDLQLSSPSGEVYKGNVFDTAAGFSITGGTADPINNVEMVRLASPEIGPWTVTVNGTAVNQGSQGYALVATGQIDNSGGGGVRYASHQIDDSGLLGNGDGIPDPGETITLPLTLFNQRPDPATAVSAKLFAGESSQAKVTDTDADFPNMNANTAASSLSPHYTLTLSPDLACGETVAFDVVATHTEGQDDSSFSFQIGSDALESAAADVPLTIPTFSAIPTTSTIQIDEALTIADVQVSVHIEHDNIGEMFIQLTSPNATPVVLHNYSDPGVADLVVTYPVDRLPDGPGALSDFAGESAAGAWTLSITDIAPGDPVTPAGTLVDWSLKLTLSDGIVCSPLECAGDPVPPPVAPTMATAKENGTDLRFNWSPVSTAAAYRIWRSATPDFAREELLAVTTATTHLELGALTDGLDWHYGVNAVNSCEWESALDCGGDPLPREVAATMTLGKENATDLRFDWSAVSGASAYRVRRSAAADFVPSETLGESLTTSFLQPGELNDPENGFYLIHALNSCDWEGP